MIQRIKTILIVTIAVSLSLPLFLIILLCCMLEMPKEWLKELILQLEGDTRIEIFYQIRPDLLDPDPVEGDGGSDEYEFVLPIKRTIRHRFGDIGSFDGTELDYIVFDCDGDNIYSIGDGVVAEADGTSITVRYEASDEDPNNWYIFAKYFPLSRIDVEAGEQVTKGQIIAAADVADEFDDEKTKLRIFCFAMWGDSDTANWVDPVQFIGEKSFEEQYSEVIRE